MRYLLDTNICIYVMNRRPASVQARLAEVSLGDVAISSVTAYELRYGVLRSVRQKENTARLNAFLEQVRVMDFDGAAAEWAARVRHTLEQLGAPIGEADRLIAGHALSLPATVVTHSAREFARVPGLSVEDWA